MFAAQQKKKQVTASLRVCMSARVRKKKKKHVISQEKTTIRRTVKTFIEGTLDIYSAFALAIKGGEKKKTLISVSQVQRSDKRKIVDVMFLNA